MEKVKIYFWVKILAVIGLILGSFLMWEQVSRPAWQPCNINATVNCDAVISGEVAKTLGIPTPLYGLVGYTLILLGAFTKNKKLILGMATFGLVFCMYIAYRELFQLRVICPVCIGCQVDMIITFVLAIVLNKAGFVQASGR
ncbi:MAG: vitamin K epoxide reductase [uncultured bacterium]|nr:MAG: vitamin K epoxide reductase [uncultured bacterium]